jgi:hypothetical protein
MEEKNQDKLEDYKRIIIEKCSNKLDNVEEMINKLHEYVNSVPLEKVICFNEIPSTIPYIEIKYDKNFSNSQRCFTII